MQSITETKTARNDLMNIHLPIVGKQRDAIGDLQTSLKCPICKTTAKSELRQLPKCGHSLCKSCLDQLSRQSQSAKQQRQTGARKNMIECPICRTGFHTRGVAEDQLVTKVSNMFLKLAQTYSELISDLEAATSHDEAESNKRSVPGATAPSEQMPQRQNLQSNAMQEFMVLDSQMPDDLLSPVRSQFGVNTAAPCTALSGINPTPPAVKQTTPKTRGTKRHSAEALQPAANPLAADTESPTPSKNFKFATPTLPARKGRSLEPARAARPCTTEPEPTTPTATADTQTRVVAMAVAGTQCGTRHVRSVHVQSDDLRLTHSITSTASVHIAPAATADAAVQHQEDDTAVHWANAASSGLLERVVRQNESVGRAFQKCADTKHVSAEMLSKHERLLGVALTQWAASVLQQPATATDKPAGGESSSLSSGGESNQPQLVGESLDLFMEEDADQQNDKTIEGQANDKVALSSREMEQLLSSGNSLADSQHPGPPLRHSTQLPASTAAPTVHDLPPAELFESPIEEDEAEAELLATQDPDSLQDDFGEALVPDTLAAAMVIPDPSADGRLPPTIATAAAEQHDEVPDTLLRAVTPQMPPAVADPPTASLAAEFANDDDEEEGLILTDSDEALPQANLKPKRPAVVCFSGFAVGFEGQMELFKRLPDVASLGRRFDPNTTTHVVLCTINSPDVRQALRTLKYMQGIAHRCWILNHKWLVDCSNQRRLVDEAAYEILTDTVTCEVEYERAPERSRTSGRGLFQGERFVLLPVWSCYGTDPGLNNEVLGAMLRAQGGQVLSGCPPAGPSAYLVTPQVEANPTHARVLGDLIERHEHVTAVNVNFVLNSIAAFTCMKIDEFLVTPASYLPENNQPQ